LVKNSIRVLSSVTEAYAAINALVMITVLL